MPAIASYSLTGDAYIDGILGDYKWAMNSLTYSFPASGSYYGSSYGSGENIANFGTFNTAQQAATHAALNMFASVANLSFNKITESSTQHADLRFALSDKPDTAWAYFPTTSAVGGDAWFNKSSEAYNTPLKGNYAYLTFMHEIGHALGLEHAHETNIMPQDRDSIEYTVMSYRSYVGASTTSGYVNETWGYAQSLMMYDISALQHLYGANYTTNSSNTTYSWSPATGEMFINNVGQEAPGGNKPLLTVWDGGGTDTYDFSGYNTNLTVNLQPGGWTTTATSQLAKLHWDGSKVAVGNFANALLHKGDARALIENAVGGFGYDALTGNDANNSLKGAAGNDRLAGGRGNDTLDGGTGDDTVVFSGERSSYKATRLSDGSIQLADLRAGTPDGQDIIWGAEWLQFTDRLYSAAELTSDPVAVPLTLATSTPDSLTLTGTNSSNTLSGGAGDDKLYGQGGSDILVGSGGRDHLSGGTGTDMASYASATAAVLADLLYASRNTRDASGDRYSSVENLTGSAYADSLRGNNAANTIQGRSGNDTLYGRSGNDKLVGGIGKDILYGGSGADTFDFNAITEVVPGARDTIKDFGRGSDRIDLRSIDANSRLAGDQAFSFIGSKTFTGSAGQLKFSNGVLSGDVNGNKVADFQINVSGLSALAKTDFYL